MFLGKRQGLFYLGHEAYRIGINKEVLSYKKVNKINLYQRRR